MTTIESKLDVLIQEIQQSREENQDLKHRVADQKKSIQSHEASAQQYRAKYLKTSQLQFKNVPLIYI
jgi:cell division septum initiation protein DivIVA